MMTSPDDERGYLRDLETLLCLLGGRIFPCIDSQGQDASGLAKEYVNVVLRDRLVG